MVFLSQIYVNKTTIARNNLHDGYKWHQKLWTLFPNSGDKKRDFLFRLDDKGLNFRVLLLSKSEPLMPQWARGECKTVSPHFLNYATYRFQLKANPTRRRDKDKRRLGIYNEDELRRWIEHKASIHGFFIAGDSLDIGAPIDEFFTRGKKRGKHTVVDFKGVLKVTDKCSFQEAFLNGIGSAKAFGYGMLMLQPIK